jgi:putative aminopeptidase FrvX
MSDVFALSEQIGVRPTGSGHEAAAATYIVQELAECGYEVEEQPFTTPEGFGTRNIIATRTGTLEGYRFVIGAHYDSSGTAKGAVDDASGVGVVMEEARVFAGRRLKPTVSFVFLGANAPGSTVEEDRLLGARHFIAMLGSLDRKDVAGMIAVDSVACGDYLVLRTQETGLQRLRDKMATFARESNLPVTTLKSTVDSDNIPFEDAQIPAVWVQWCNAGGQEPADDSYAVVMAGKIESAGNLIRSFLLDLTQDDLRELKY